MGYIITINSESKQALDLVKYLKNLDFVKVKKEKDVLTKPEKKSTVNDKEKLIEALAKSTNKAITKRMFTHFNIPYPEENDSDCR